MADIGKITITSEWAKVEDLIKAQVDGQSSFAFDTSKKYLIQTDCEQGAPFGARFAICATEPTEADAGGHLSDDQSAEYTPKSGEYLWVKTRGNTTDVKVYVTENA